MRKINKIVGIIGIIGLVGCEKDINIDYHETPPIYVVEASVNNSLMVARLSTTKPMDDNSSRSDVNDATIMIDLLLSGTELPPYADVDGDGKVSIYDITVLIDSLLND